MRTELSFLMDLFLSDDTPQPIKKMVADRIREVEDVYTKPQVVVPRGRPIHITQEGLDQVPGFAPQAPSMQRIMEQHPEVPTGPAPLTPAAAMALQARQALIKQGMSEKPEQGMTSKRKI